MSNFKGGKTERTYRFGEGRGGGVELRLIRQSPSRWRWR